jgi:hypothetical protein
LRIQINISSANEVYNKKGTSLIASQRLTAKCWRGVLARYHTGIVKLGVAITSEPHLCKCFSFSSPISETSHCKSYSCSLATRVCYRRFRALDAMVPDEYEIEGGQLLTL